MKSTVVSTVKELFQGAKEQLKQGELEEALELARRLLAKDDTSFQHWMLEGSIRVALGEWQPAERAYRRACQEAPHSPVPWLECAKLSMALGQTVDAYEYATEAFALTVQVEDRRDALHIQAESLYASLQKRLAANVSEETALSLDPGPPASPSLQREVIEDLSTLTAKEESRLEEELKRGIRLVEKAISLDENVAELWELKARYLLLRGDPEGALRSQKKAVELNPADADSWYLLGTLSLQQENEEEARAAFRQVHQLDERGSQDALIFLPSDFERWARMAWSDLEENWNETLDLSVSIKTQVAVYPEIALLEYEEEVFDPRSPLSVDVVQEGTRESIRLRVYQSNVEREAMTVDPEECYRVLYQLLEETVHLFLDALQDEEE